MKEDNNTIKEFLLAPEIIPVIEEINGKYSIQDGYLAGLIYNLTLGDLKLEKITDYIEKDLKIDQEAAKNISIEVLGRILLCIEHDLDADIKGLITKLGGDPKQYFDQIEELHDKIFKPKEEKAVKTPEVVPEEEFTQTPEEEKKSLETLFSNELVEIMEEKEQEVTSFLNYRILNLLVEHPEFKPDIERTIFENNQKITKNQINLEGTKVEPTISNWLKDFVSRVGIDSITAITQSKYITDSVNTKNLPFKERQTLSKLIDFYVRLKFFPDSLEKLPPNEWGVIPMKVKAEMKIKKGLSAQTGQAGESKSKETEPQIEELQKQYEAIEDKNSLQAMAIKEEIERLTKA